MQREEEEVPGVTTELWDYWTNSLECSRGIRFLEDLGQETTVFHFKVAQSIDLKISRFSLFFLCVCYFDKT